MSTTSAPEKSLLRDWLRPDAPPNQQISAKAIGKQLGRHLDEPVMSGKRVLTLRAQRDPHTRCLSIVWQTNNALELEFAEFAEFAGFVSPMRGVRLL